jgi:hypothetical protein
MYVYVKEVSNFDGNKGPKHILEENKKTANIGGKCTVLNNSCYKMGYN